LKFNGKVLIAMAVIDSASQGTGLKYAENNGFYSGHSTLNKSIFFRMIRCGIKQKLDEIQ
jgi:hypothetical protein